MSTPIHSAGHPLPLGVSQTHTGLNFAVFSRHATSMSLVLFSTARHERLAEIRLDPTFNRTGDVWHIAVDGLDSRVRYGWRADRQPVARDAWHRFDAGTVLTDPYARALSGGSEWGESYRREGQPRHAPRAPRRSLYVDALFDWQQMRAPHVRPADRLIYELHVRSFTQHASSGVQHPGTYLGLIEKIPYLLDLGVTTVELLPVYEFDESEIGRTNPETGEPLRNLWGYNPICFFAPKAAYAVRGRDGAQVGELKTLVRELHRAGLEVFLDVVFNHTAEGGGSPQEPTFSFRGLDNKTYYMLDPETGAYRDYTGCGNTLNCNHPVVRDLIRDALRYWVAEMHVDGFRFDLASVLSRGQDGEVLPFSPLIERIAADPVLANATLIAEPWDAAGLYQVGRFPSFGRWAEWNGPFRDDVRCFVRGDPGFTNRLATRLAGSADLFQSSARPPSHSINFVTCHDGFTLADLVAYDRKHNQANGEQNRDGNDHNLSWNCGSEGPTNDPAIQGLRRRQTRNFLTLLFLARGTPMLLAGDELGRTQRGNNNAYCQDNEVSWVNWGLLEENRDLFRFVKLLIALRRKHPVLRADTFYTGRGATPSAPPDVAWHGPTLDQPDWSPNGRMLAMHVSGAYVTPRDSDFYLAANNTPEACNFELPAPPAGRRWLRIIDTAQASPNDIADRGREAVETQGEIAVAAFSCVVLRSA